MTRFWKTKEFSELSREWAERLSKSEFNDIEVEINGERKLIRHETSMVRDKYKTAFYAKSKAEFYEAVSSGVENDKAMPSIDRFIMANYSQGVKQCDILKMLEGLGYKCHRITVIRRISSYLHKWGIRLPKKK